MSHDIEYVDDIDVGDPVERKSGGHGYTYVVKAIRGRPDEFSLVTADSEGYSVAVNGRHIELSRVHPDGTVGHGRRIVSRDDFLREFATVEYEPADNVWCECGFESPLDDLDVGNAAMMECPECGGMLRFRGGGRDGSETDSE